MRSTGFPLVPDRLYDVTGWCGFSFFPTAGELEYIDALVAAGVTLFFGLAEGLVNSSLLWGVAEYEVSLLGGVLFRLHIVGRGPPAVSFIPEVLLYEVVGAEAVERAAVLRRLFTLPSSFALLPGCCECGLGWLDRAQENAPPGGGAAVLFL